MSRVVRSVAHRTRPPARPVVTFNPGCHAPLPPRPITVEQYHGLIESGILQPDDRVELINEWIVEKMPNNPPHASTVKRVNDRLQTLLEPDYCVRSQSPITLPKNEPEPDCVVATGPATKYFPRHPGVDDLLFIAEVADSSRNFVREMKNQVYAAVGIPVYWIVNVKDRIIEVYTKPGNGKSPGYKSRKDYRPGTSVPVVVGGKKVGTVPVDELLP
jgi:Uma2 family endonuclease